MRALGKNIAGINLQRHKRELSVAATYAFLLLLLVIFRPVFFEGEFANNCVSDAPLLVAAIGMTLVIIARHIDISIGAQFSICAVSSALLSKTGLPMPLVALVTIAIGCAMGAFNGAMVAFLNLPSIVVTLGSMAIMQDALRLVRQGAPVEDMPAGFQWFGQGQTAGKWLIVLTALVLFAAFAVGMRLLAAGRAIYAVGSDPEAARLAGIRPKRVVFWVFVLMGALIGVSGLLGAVHLAQVDAKGGQGMELAVIAAVVVGGTAVAGGRGTLAGSLFGVLLLGVITPALFFLGGKAYWEKAIQGGIIILAVASDALKSMPRSSAPAPAALAAVGRAG